MKKKYYSKLNFLFALLLLCPSTVYTSQDFKDCLKQVDGLSHDNPVVVKCPVPKKAKKKKKKMLDRMTAEEGKWRRAGFKNPKTFSLEDSLYNFKNDVPYTHGFPVEILIFRGSKWSSVDIIHHYRVAAKTFAQCGVKMLKPRLTYVDAPGKVVDYPSQGYDKNNKRSPSIPIARKINRAVGKNRVVNIHVRSLTNGSKGTAGAEWFFGKNDPRLNKQWINGQIRKRPSRVVAHEMFHTLADARHVDVFNTVKRADRVDNLMNASIIGKKIQPDQCKDLQTFHKTMKRI